MQPPWRMFWELILQTCRTVALVSSQQSCQSIRAEREKSIIDAAVRVLRSENQPDEWSAQDKHVVEWLEYCSWGRCSQCDCMYQRTMTQSEIDDPSSSRSHLQDMCYQCKTHVDRRSEPHVSRLLFPVELLGLPSAVCIALRVVVLHQGFPVKHPHGYKRKSQMSRLSWCAETVEARISHLEEPLQSKGVQALQWLRANSAPYLAWYTAHRKVLDAGDSLRLWPSAILEPYVESALWPHLYFTKRLCESHLHAACDWSVPFASCSGSSVAHARASAKDAFVQKLLSCIPDYAMHYDLLQFQFDRHILKSVKHRCSAASAQGFDAHLAMQHQHWTPGFWKRQHRLLLDVVDQLGYPDLFLIISPYEWLFPFPYWLRKVHSVAMKGPTEMAGPEVLCVAHALHQICRGLLAGQTNGRWKTHVFADKTNSSAGGIKCFFGRFEFQEGGVEQVYGRGRGSIHLHCLFWFHLIRNVLLELAIAASAPVDRAEAAVLASRVLKGGTSKAPVNQGPSTWTWSSSLRRWTLQLHVTASFLADCLRPFLVSLLLILRCSQDVQWWHGEGALLRYVSGYVSKYAEHWNDEWLKDAGSSAQAGLNVCRGWKPTEAEMVMTLARESMVLIGCDHKDYRPPAYNQPEDAVLYCYRRRDVVHQELTCLQWYRVHTVSGSVATENLSCTPRKRKDLMAVGVWYYEFPKDQFFWQYLIMNYSHRDFRDLLPSACFLVSPNHRFLAAALLLMPQNWGNDVWIHDWLQQQGRREEWIRTQVLSVAAIREMIQLQIQGTIPKHSATSSRVGSSAQLSSAQKVFVDSVFGDLQLRLECAEYGSDMSEACLRWQPRFLSGGPGSGKSRCAHAIMERAAEAGLHVLVASPTGQLASTVAWSSGVQSMTISRAFGLSFGSKLDRHSFLAQFDMWIVGELGMVTKDDFDHILSWWFALNRRPVMVFEGDLNQLPPPVPESARQDVRLSRWWPLLKQFCLHSQFRCSDPELLHFQMSVRCAAPSQETVATFFQDTCIGEAVNAQSLRCLWSALPDCFVLCATRATVSAVNGFGLEYFGGPWLGSVPAWTLQGDADIIAQVQVRVGTRLMITRNADIEHGMCNGAYCSVLSLTSAGIIMQLGSRIDCLHRRSQWSGDILQVGFDVSLGYACTVHKAEGATLDSCCIVFENFSPPGWGYTAVTRVRQKSHLRTIGIAEPTHFTPRCFTDIHVP